MKREEAIVINNLFDLKVQLSSLLDHYKRHTDNNGKTNIIVAAKEEYSPKVIFEGPQADYMILFLQDLYDKIDKELEEMEVFGIKYAPKYIFCKYLDKEEKKDEEDSE